MDQTCVLRSYDHELQSRLEPLKELGRQIRRRMTYQALCAIIDSDRRDEPGVELALTVEAEERGFSHIRITEKQKFQ